jgi:hypothetical protein
MVLKQLRMPKMVPFFTHSIILAYVWGIALGHVPIHEQITQNDTIKHNSTLFACFAVLQSSAYGKWCILLLTAQI